MNTSGPPQKVTLRKLRQEIPGFTASLRHNAYWPLTEQALEEVLESTEHFAIRRIQWAAQQYLLLEERKPLSKKKLVQKAGVYGYRHQPMIQATIQEAMRKLAFLT